MALIDDKGKLFGKINIIDLTVLLILLLIAGGVAVKMQKRGKESNVRETTIKAIFQVRPDVVGAIQEGDKLVVGSSFVDAEIVGIDIQPATQITTKADGQMVQTTDPFRKDVTVTIKGNATVTGGEIKMAGQEIRVYKEFFLKTQKAELKGFVIHPITFAGE